MLGPDRNPDLTAFGRPLSARALARTTTQTNMRTWSSVSTRSANTLALKQTITEELTMSHHYSGPNIGFPRGDARLDLTDLYAFRKPGDPGKSILIMNVHPSVGLNPPGPTTSEPFAPEARYELKIDTDGDAVANISYEVRFASVEGGEQTATLRRVDGTDVKVIVESAPIST